MRKGDPYREGGESCASCIELARENGELRAAKKSRTRTTWAQAAAGAIMVGSMIAGSLMLTAWIHGCASAPPAPEAPARCHDSAVIVRSTDSTHQCTPGATVFTEIVRGENNVEHALVRCVCAGAEVGPRFEAAERPR